MDENLKAEIDKKVAKAQLKIINEHKLKEINQLLIAWSADGEIWGKLIEIKNILISRLEEE